MTIFDTKSATCIVMRTVKAGLLLLLTTLTVSTPAQQLNTKTRLQKEHHSSGAAMQEQHHEAGTARQLHTTAADSPAQVRDTVVTLLFAGDIMGHDAQIAAALDDSTGLYTFENVFQYVAPYISAADLSIGNLEVTLGGAPYKGYPAFSSPDALAVACLNAGFEILGTANNHSADRGSTGLLRTLRVLDSLGIRHTGTWGSPALRDSLTPFMVSEEPVKIAMQASTYGTNGIVLTPPPLVAYIDTLQAAAEIREARLRGAEQIIAFIHWGIEYDTLPSAGQQTVAAALFRSGADIIIGAHPHVLQPIEAISDSNGIRNPVVWSMGNFVSNQRARRRDGGMMIRLDISAKGDSTFISDAGYILTWVYTPVENGKKRYYILPCAEYENRPEFFQEREYYQAMMLFVSDARRLLQSRRSGFREMTLTGGEWVTVERAE